MKARKAPCLGVVLTDPTDSVPSLDRTENSTAIESFSGICVHGIIGRIDDLRNPHDHAQAVIGKILSSLDS